MAKAKSRRAPARPALDQLITNTLGKLSDEFLSRGTVHVEIEGGGGAFHLHRGGHIDAASGGDASVRIRGSEERIRALLGGKKHPTAVFIEGGIHVEGDVRQITALSEELPILTLKRKPN